MKAIILNSGLGSRMGDLTKASPKCLVQIDDKQTILGRQLQQLARAGIHEVIITTGYLAEQIEEYCRCLNLPLSIRFVKNEAYANTNYIYSIYQAREWLMDDDLIILHGDLVFEDVVLDQMLVQEASCVVVSSVASIDNKDFKAQIENQLVVNVGIDITTNAQALQPFYKLKKDTWAIWLKQIVVYCEANNVKCYAENALNEVLHLCHIKPFDVEKFICHEVDNLEDLEKIRQQLKAIPSRLVYMCFSTDFIHGGHIDIISKAARIGTLMVGIMSDEAIASFKRYPLIPYSERKEVMESIRGVSHVVEQHTLSYRDNLLKYKPDFVVHGDDWLTGFQAPIREEVVATLSEIKGKLVEYPYSKKQIYAEIERKAKEQMSSPDMRRGRLRKLLSIKKTISIIEAHSGITGLIAENTVVLKDGCSYQFDGMWVSSLCDSTAKGKPDIELVDMSSRIRTIDDIMEVTTKPIILDGDTGGLNEHFVYNVRTLERIGVSAVIIEDKTGLKKNSLFGTDVVQTQDSIENFASKIAAGKKAQKTKEFMIIARIESLILEKGMVDALTRAEAFVKAGADGIMIHSRKKSPDEIFEFVEKFRMKDKTTPIVVVPTSFNSVTQEEFARRGVNVVIYANQLTRSGIPAMQKVAKTILVNQRAKEADDMCMPINEILTLIPEQD